MRGDVWVRENKNGEKVVCIDTGKFVAEKIVKIYLDLYGHYCVYSCIRNGS